ncbi:hypothetical protein [Halocynthiibacter styelae]|uniref:Porin n=1 Tax=Halocynthiibacter styelae TaxID=2761955 RepID=A0A8J7IXD7_9RHOB|nr:hypothetical protein [Paenihalocynthiibacter styelae]MBI1493810.1 hypothetical protein [Paenihalocynthiibacter styelae]
MRDIFKPAIPLALLAGMSFPAHAERLGSLGLSYTNHSGESVSDNIEETSHGLTADYSLGWVLGDRNRIIIDALYRSDTYSANMAEGDPFGDQAQIGLHYQYALSERLSLGLFAGHGRADHDDPREDYIVNFIGLEGIYNPGGHFTFFAQLGAVDSPNSDSQSSSGYDNGEIYRLGVTYTGWERTSVLFDFEYGQSDEYEDSNEPGEFLVVGLSGETRLRNNPKWAINYGIRYGKYNARNDDDNIEETSVTLGARYYFGRSAASSNSVADGLIGLPYTPLRASAWTPALD